MSSQSRTSFSAQRARAVRAVHGRQQRIVIYAREQLDIGRADIEKLLDVEERTISNHHLRLRCVVYEDDDEAAVAPMIYFRVLSFNSVELKRPDNGHNTGVAISRGHGDILLGSGDLLRLTPEIFLQFQYNSYIELENALNKSQRAEAKSFANQYFLSGRRLGVGGQASVYIAVKQSDKRQFACKAVPLTHTRTHVRNDCGEGLRLTTDKRRTKLLDERDAVAREYVVLEKLNHPNIISLEKVICATNNVYIFQELITGGDLSSYINQEGALAEPQAAAITLQLLKAVEYLHGNGFAHRDIKPENILMTSWREGTRVVLTDFGQARAINGTHAVQKNAKALRMYSLVGTYGYTAPEIIHRVRQSLHDLGYSNAVDVWSIGCVATVLLTGNALFSQDATDLRDAKDLSPETYRERYDVDIIDHDGIWAEISRKAKSFVRECLAQDETRRPTAQEALQHNWFTNKHYCAELQAAYGRAVADWQPRKEQGNLIELMDTKYAFGASSNSESTQDVVAESKSKHFQAAHKPVVLPIPSMKKSACVPLWRPQLPYQYPMSRGPKGAAPSNSLMTQPLSVTSCDFVSPIRAVECNPLSGYTLGAGTGPLSIYNYGPPQTQYTEPQAQALKRHDSVSQPPSTSDEPTQTRLTSPVKSLGRPYSGEIRFDSQETQVPINSEAGDRPKKKVCRR